MAMSDERREHYRQALLVLRRRIAGSVDRAVDTLNDDANTLANLSSVPIHPADVAQAGTETDAEVLDNESQLLHSIDTALARLGEGLYGTCEACEGEIPEARLQALPFATMCAACAAADEKLAPRRRGNPRSVPAMRLTGFEAIEYAEREGLKLNKAADRIDDEGTSLTIAEAEAIAADRADLIWLDVPASEYYGERRNMKPER